MVIYMVREQLLEKIKNLTKKEKRKIINYAIDISIKMYQECKTQENFDLIIELYQPLKYVNYWKNKYLHLCDNSIDDFIAEYMLCFVKACNFYKIKTTNNKCYFNKYFFSVLSNYFINKMNNKSCHKRNPSSKCPICDEMVSPLNIHILKNHFDFIDQFLKTYNSYDKCPLCQEILSGKMLYKHIISKHSSSIYDYFNKCFPNYNTKIQDPAPPIGLMNYKNDEIETLENIETFSLYNNEENSYFDSILDGQDLSECQKTIKDIFHYYNISKLPSYQKICAMCHEIRGNNSCPGNFKMTKNFYDREIKDLKNKISI